MKKTLLTIAMIFSTISIWAQSIPNGGFENWNTVSYNDLMYWYCSNEDNQGNPVNVTRVSDPYDGSYAVRLNTVPSGTNINIAFFANGNPMNPAGQGVPYNQQATGIQFRYKCNILPGDNGIVWIVFKKAGSVIGNYSMTVSGTQATYALKTFSFSLTQAPDSMIFAAASSDPFSYTGPAGSMFQMDSLHFTGVSSQPLNFNESFEQWQMVNSATPLGWTVNSSNSNSQTTDKYAGNYAIRLMTTSSGTVGYPGSATNGISSPSTTLGGAPFSNQIDTLVFYYKYSPANVNDSALVSLNFKKNFVFFQVISKLFPAAGSYTQAKMPINLSTAPDTLIMFLNSSKSWSITSAFAGSEFKVDNMYLTSQVVPVSDFLLATACAGQNTLILDNSSNLPTAYSWTLAGATPSTSTAQNPLVIYNTPGTYTIMHSASNSFGNSGVITKTISVNVTPTLSVTGFNTVCNGGSVVLNVTGASTYTWMAGPNTSSINVTPTITTSYSVAGTTAGCMGYAYMTVTVNPLPTITASTNNSVICITPSQSATLTANGASTYTWMPTGTGASIVVTPTATTIYTVTGTDLNGCINTAMLTQSVSACTGINESNNDNTGIFVYPNPNNGSFIIKSGTDENIIIINELGQQIKNIELNTNNQHTAQINDLTSGIYFAVGRTVKTKIVILN